MKANNPTKEITRMNHSNHFRQVLSKMWRLTSRFVKTIPIRLLALFLTGKGQAQSNVDSFDPGANNRVERYRSKRTASRGWRNIDKPRGGGMAPRRALHRPIESDGSIDATFNPGADGQVEVLRGPSRR